MTPDDEKHVAHVKSMLAEHGLENEVEFLPNVSREDKIKFLHDAQDASEVRMPAAPAPAAARADAPTPQRRAFDTVLGGDLETAAGPASIRVTSGSAAGREVALVKVVTTC